MIIHQIYHLWEKIIDKRGVNFIKVQPQNHLPLYPLYRQQENIENHYQELHRGLVRHVHRIEDHQVLVHPQEDLQVVVHAIDHLIHHMDRTKSRMSFSNIIFKK